MCSSAAQSQTDHLSVPIHQLTFQARCDETILITNWGLPLAVALFLLWLTYTFIYLPAMEHRSMVENALRNLSQDLDYGHAGHLNSN